MMTFVHTHKKNYKEKEMEHETCGHLNYFEY